MLHMIRKSIDLIRMLAGWALVVSLLVCNGSGMILCIGENGHIAVESVLNEHSEHSATDADHGHQDEAHSSAFPGNNDHGGCVDVSLDLDKVAQAVKDVKPGLLLKSSVSEVWPIHPMAGSHTDSKSAHWLAGRAPPRLSHFLAAYRTIVLRL